MPGVYAVGVQSGTAAALRAQADQVLASHPELHHEWVHGQKARKGGDAFGLTFPRRSDDGFGVALEATDQGVTVIASTDRGGMHVELETRDYASADDLVAHALGLARDLLGTGMRLRALEAGGTAYRWHLESFDGKVWRTEETMGLLLWPFWRRRAERIYSNDTLPPRAMQ
jgi:hypothetical protein